MTLVDFIAEIPLNPIEEKKIYQGQNMLQPQGDGKIIRYTAKYWIGVVLKIDCEENCKVLLLNRFKDKIEQTETIWIFDEFLNKIKWLADYARICCISNVKCDFNRWIPKKEQ